MTSNNMGGQESPDDSRHFHLSIEGSAAGRDMILGRYVVIYQGSKHLRRQAEKPLPAQQYVKPQGFDQILDTCRTDANAPTVIILTGKVGSGRKAAALSLLAGCLPSDAALWSLAPDWDEPDVEKIPNEVNSGYVLDLTGEKQDRISDLVKGLADYADAAGHVGSRLVILVQPDTWPISRTTPFGIKAFTVIAPDPVQVTIARLHTHGWSQHLTPADNESLRKLLSATPRPADAVRLAEILLSYDGDLAAAAREYSYWQDDLLEWFRNHLELRTRARLISAAVFDGCPDTLVLEAADRLLAMLRVAEPEGGPLSGADVYEDLQEAHAIISDDGAVSITANRHGYDTAVLRWVWKQRPTLRRVLVEWVADVTGPRGCARRHTERALRIVAELVADQSRTWAFELIDQWIATERPEQFELATKALETLARAPGGWALVRDKTYDWANGRDQRKLRLVAAVFGGELGRSRPGVALARIRSVLQSGIDDTATRGWAILTLRSISTDVLVRDRALSESVKWLAQDTRVGAAAFLSLVEPLDDSLNEAIEEGAGSVPFQIGLHLTQLLEDSTRDQTIFINLVTGWTRVLEGPFEEATLQVLRRWLLAWENADTSLSAAVSSILRTVLSRRTLSPDYFFAMLDADVDVTVRREVLEAAAPRRPRANPADHSVG